MYHTRCIHCINPTEQTNLSCRKTPAKGGNRQYCNLLCHSASGTTQTQGQSESNTTIERRVIIKMIKAYLEKHLKGKDTEGDKCGRDLFKLLPSLVYLSEMFPWDQQFTTGTAFYALNLHHFLGAKLIGGDERLQLIRSMNAFLPETKRSSMTRRSHKD